LQRAWFSFAGVLLAVLCQSHGGVPTPYAQTGKLAISKVTPSRQTVEQFSRLEFTVDWNATYENPFDSQMAALDAQVRWPSGKTVIVPGFLYQPFQRELTGGNEKLKPAGAPSWQVRITPVEVGKHTVTFIARDQSGTIQSVPQSFTTTAAKTNGFVRISQTDRRYFIFDNGQPYFPIGANVCWAGERGTHDYDAWFPRYAAAGCNYARLWLSPNWTTFALERAGRREEGRGLGQFDLANAWRIDYVLDLAAKHGLQVMLCIDSYNILREKDAYPQWENTPHNVAQGGPLQKPTDFWTNAVMDKLYLDKLRYLVARYGSYPNVLSWEFWNEVDITTGYKSGLARDWHQRMARALRALDPYQHLITTSTANTGGDKELDGLRELDYIQTHHYNNPDLALTVARAQAQKSRFGKPHIVGEIGADAGGPRTQDDARGYQVHDPIWASLATGGSGAAQPWWWDNFIHPRNLYAAFTPLARFSAGIDWPRERFTNVTPRVEWQSKPAPPPRKDVILKDGPVSWNLTEFNQPRKVRVTRAGGEGQLPLAGIQHGIGGHKDKHNPVTLEFDLPWPSRCELEVGKVSGHGGAILKMFLDGKEVLKQNFADPDGMNDTQDLKQYAGVYGIDVPAGKHEVVVENVGADWFMTSYRLKQIIEATGPPVLAWGIAGQRTAIVWARVEDRNWRRLCVYKEKFAPAPPSVISLSGLSPGNWKAEVWNTWTGDILQRQEIKVDASGSGRVLVDSFEHDVAVKLTR
jgi:hypothetical protein